MHKNRSVDVHQFAMVPRADIPRSAFRMQKALKTTFDGGYLVPMMCEEVLPGDTFNVRLTAFARLATPIFPFMDNLHFETFFFFVPCRLVWENWVRFQGEREDPNDSISYVVPQMLSPLGGYGIMGLHDYFGLPTAGQVDPAYAISHNALPLRAYNLIYNEWFRDQNLQNSRNVPKGDGPDSYLDFTLQRRGKRPDYFTTALPWTQKGASVMLPLGSTAPVRTQATEVVTGAQQALRMRNTAGNLPGGAQTLNMSAAGNVFYSGTASGAFVADVYPTNLVADLSTATAATINQIRQAFQIQRLLERDARGGTRYTEIVQAHFGVRSPDARLQRPEYLGGGHSPITINPIAQTSATGVSGGTSPQGNLSAMGTMMAHGHGFSQSFTEHGYIIGLMNVRADLTYQQGIRKLWTRQTRYDFYMPVFAMLGEQAILSQELYCDGSSADQDVFGYQERWAEYRYNPSQVTGLMRSTAAGTIDAWHLAQRFTTRPTLGSAFIVDAPPISRVVAVDTEPEFILDAFFDCKVARPMPMYSVPGMVDHF